MFDKGTKVLEPGTNKVHIPDFFQCNLFVILTFEKIKSIYRIKNILQLH